MTESLSQPGFDAPDTPMTTPPKPKRPAATPPTSKPRQQRAPTPNPLRQADARWQRTVRYGWDKGGAKGGR